MNRLEEIGGMVQRRRAEEGDGLLYAAVADLLAVAEAAAEVRDGAGVELADDRLDYLVLQVDKADWHRLVDGLDVLTDAAALAPLTEEENRG